MKIKSSATLKPRLPGFNGDQSLSGQTKFQIPASLLCYTIIVSLYVYYINFPFTTTSQLEYFITCQNSRAVNSKER